VAQLTAKFQEDQEKLTAVTEPLRAIWLGILILLEEYEKAANNDAGEHSAGDYEAHKTLAQKLLRIGRNKGQAFKVWKEMNPFAMVAGPVSWIRMHGQQN